MASALFAAVMPEPPAASPRVTAPSKSPWWKRRHASCAAASLGKGSQSPRCSLSQFFRNASPGYAKAFAGRGNVIHFTFAIGNSPSVDVLAAQLLEVAARFPLQVGGHQCQDLV